MVADCMSHGCTMVADEGAPLPHPRPLLEACCQYGADTDLTERDAILGRHEAARVRFTVYTKGGKAALKATPLKE